MIFITGCNGLIGSAIARRLILNGETIVALKRKNSDMSLVKDIEESIKWIEGDLLDIEVLNTAMKNCSTVIHAAAIISFASSKRNKMYSVNVQGTANVVNAALINSIKQFCFISSIAAIGRKKNAPILNEKTLWEDSELNTHYAKSKYLAELEVWRGIEEGLPAFIVNPSVVLGAGNMENGSTKLFNYIFKKNKLYTEGYINYVDLIDVVNITMALLSKKSVGERYILNAGNITIKELFIEIANGFKVPAPSIKVGRFISEIVWRIEFVRSLFTSAEPILTKETVRLANHSFKYSNTKIKDFLNYQFKPLNETIKAVTEELMVLSNVNKN